MLWHRFMVIKRKCVNIFVCAYYVLYFLIFPELKLSVCVRALDYRLLKCYRYTSFILPDVSQNFLVQLTSEKPLQMGETITRPKPQGLGALPHTILLLDPGVCCTPCLLRTPLFPQQEAQVAHWKEGACYGCLRSLLWMFKGPQSSCACYPV